VKRFALTFAIVAGCGGGGATSARRSGPPETVRVTVLDRGQGDPALSARDGDGPWLHVPLFDGEASFEVTSGVYDLAVSCEGTVQLYHATPAELSQIHALRCGVHETYWVDLAVAGLAEGHRARAIGSLLEKVAKDDGSVRVMAFPGAADLAVADTVVDGDQRTASRVALVRDLDVTEDTALGIDLDADATATERRDVALDGNDPGERVVVESRLELVHGDLLVLSVDQEPPYQADVVPPALLRDGDRDGIFAFGSHEQERRWARADGGAIVLPRYLGEMSASLRRKPSGLGVTWTRDPDASWYRIQISQPDHGGLGVFIVITPGALPAGDTIDFQTPPPSPLLHDWLNPDAPTALALESFHGGAVSPDDALWTAHSGASTAGAVAPPAP
jgi:hypothetical protein